MDMLDPSKETPPTSSAHPGPVTWDLPEVGKNSSPTSEGYTLCLLITCGYSCLPDWKSVAATYVPFLLRALCTESNRLLKDKLSYSCCQMMC